VRNANLMAKDSDGRSTSVGVLFCCFPQAQKERNMKNPPKKCKITAKKDVIAYRKTCKAQGTGLSHYILMDKKAK
jgi:modified peptide precursor CbpA